MVTAGCSFVDSRSAKKDAAQRVEQLERQLVELARSSSGSPLVGNGSRHR
jgi:hypothetical protein